MKERGIIYSAPMVLALRAGRKTQTRRIVKPAPIADTRFSGGFHVPSSKRTEGAQISVEAPYVGLACPYGKPGDVLWTRETWMPDPPRDGTWSHVAFDGCKPRDMSLIPERFRAPAHCIYRATWEGSPLVGWVPAIHMFRWASRMAHELTQVRCQQLQDISEADAIAEGIERYAGPLRWVRYLDAVTGEAKHSTARDAYFSLWEHLHGPGSVDANPWLWAMSFKEVK